MTVRPCRETDLPALREICLETAFSPPKSEAEKQFLLWTYCDPYVCGDHTVSLVAADEADEAAGYIFCAPDCAAFAAAFRREYLPKIRTLSKRYALTATLNLWMYSFFSKRYEAHLHIDLSDAARHQGVGSRLMTELKAQLSSRGVRGLMLCCASKNENAIRFYLRNGFQIKIRAFGACIMACEIKKS